MRRWNLSTVALGAVGLALLSGGTLADDGLALFLEPAWEHRFDWDRNGGDIPTSMAVGGGSVFVGGYTYHGVDSFHDWGLVAYDAATGATQWKSEFRGAERNGDFLESMALCAAQNLLVGGGYIWEDQSGSEAATVAWDAVSGSRIWNRTVLNGGHVQVALANDCETVFTLADAGSEPDFVIAYDAWTGDERWRSASFASGYGSILVSRDGGTVYAGAGETVALDPLTGEERWRSPISGLLVESLDGAAVFAAAKVGQPLAGVETPGSLGLPWPATEAVRVAALAASSGDMVWSTTSLGLPSTILWVRDIGISADGQRVYVAGDRLVWASAGGTGVEGAHWVTVAYQASDGELLWEAPFATIASNPYVLTGNRARTLAVHPTLDVVFVAGESEQAHAYAGEPFLVNPDLTVVAYDGSSGLPLGLATYDGPVHSQDLYPTGHDSARALALEGSRLYVAGASEARYGDWLTKAYDVRLPIEVPSLPEP